MGLGDMLGKAAGMMGGDMDIMAKLEELGVDPAMIENLDVDAAKSFLEEKGLDLSMLDNLGIDVEGLIAKLKGEA